MKQAGKSLLVLLLASVVLLSSSCQKQSIEQDVEETGSHNGVYYGELMVGITETLTIQNYSEKGFDFEFELSRISGHAEYSNETPESVGVAFYYDEDGQGINFEFDKDGVIVGGGHRYGSLAAHYTP